MLRNLDAIRWKSKKIYRSRLLMSDISEIIDQIELQKHLQGSLKDNGWDIERKSKQPTKDSLKAARRWRFATKCSKTQIQRRTKNEKTGIT